MLSGWPSRHNARMRECLPQSDPQSPRAWIRAAFAKSCGGSSGRPALAGRRSGGLRWRRHAGVRAVALPPRRPRRLPVRRRSPGADLRREPLELRKRDLSKLLRNALIGLQLNEHVDDLPGSGVLQPRPLVSALNHRRHTSTTEGYNEVGEHGDDDDEEEGAVSIEDGG